MARADLLIDIAKAGAEGDQALFQKALEALITEERSKQHNILADRLAEHLNLNGKPMRPTRLTAAVPNGEANTNEFLLEGCYFSPFAFLVKVH